MRTHGGYKMLNGIDGFACELGLKNQDRKVDGERVKVHNWDRYEASCEDNIVIH